MLRFFGLILTLSLSFSSFAQGTGPLFTVQIGTFLDSKSSDFESIRDYGFLYADALGGNMSRIYLGGYNSFESAEAIAQIARDRGYIDAMVMELDPAQGQTATVIQLGVKDAKKTIDWSDYESVGRLFVILNNDMVKVVTGTYGTVDAAKAALKEIRQKGFDDAFIKNVNSVLLHEVDAFILGRPAAIPTEYGATPTAGSTRGVPENIPNSYNEETVIPKGPVTPPPPRYLDLDRPDTRSNIKRTSALDLQRFLKKENVYQGSLDGYYGPGTSSAYDQVFENHETLQKYRQLARDGDYFDDPDPVGIQRHINNIPYDPRAAASALATSSAPIAKAYRAYLFFMAGQTGPAVNTLMNEAIDQAFNTGGPNPVPGFDYKASYAYTKLDQLILHMRYIHAATGDANVPCWLFQRHPQEAARAFEPGESMSAGNYQIQACGAFTQWEEVRVLLTVAHDMSAQTGVDQEALAVGKSEQARYLLVPKPLSAEQARAMEKWNQNLHLELAEWALKDPLLEEVYTAFGVSYNQSRVMLEDYFMNKGLNSGESKALALATLKAMVGPYLQRFTS